MNSKGKLANELCYTGQIVRQFITQCDQVAFTKDPTIKSQDRIRSKNAHFTTLQSTSYAPFSMGLKIYFLISNYNTKQCNNHNTVLNNAINSLSISFPLLIPKHFHNKANAKY